MVGILVYGDNHFIVLGPLPSRQKAIELARHWSLITIGASNSPDLAGWRISTKEYRENLIWAVSVPGEGELNPEVSKLLSELEARGIRVHDAGTEDWG
jgi:hypothetical protein